MKKYLAIILATVIMLAAAVLPCAAYEPKTAKAVKATAIIDAEMEDIWKETDALTVDLVNKTIIYDPNYSSQTTATVRFLWDEKYLYVFAEVLDSDLYTENKNGSANYIADGIEFQIDEENNKTGKNNVSSGNPAAGSFQVFADGAKNGFGDLYTAGMAKFRSAVKVNDNGYTVEAAMPWNTLSPEVGTQIGVEIQINDNITGDAREGLVSWNSDACLGWQDTEAMGTLTFADSPEGYVPPEIPEDSEPVTSEEPVTSQPDTEPAESTGKNDTDKTPDTDAKVTTDAKTDAAKPSDNGGISPWIWVAIAAVVIIVAVAAVVAAKKKAAPKN